jgi:LPS O-antigen subunit length determinant protein (WzzB/FepE family)
VIIGIVVAAVVVMATAIVIVACLFYRKKRGKANSRDIDSIQNTAYEGNTSRNMELQKIPDPESIYEEPAEYTQLASSLREPVDENYQSLLNVQNYEQPDTDYNEKFQQYASMNMESNPSKKRGSWRI